MRAKTIAFLALLAAALVTATPSGAFNYATMSRAVTVNVVTDATAYNAISNVAGTPPTCTGSSPITVTKCNMFTITNKGTTDVTYRIMKMTDTGSGKLVDYAFGGVAATSSGWTTATASKSAGSAVTMIVNVSACVTCTTAYYANFTVEAQKANVLDFNESRIMVVVSTS